MKKLIKFLRHSYPSIVRNKIQVTLLAKGEEYCVIAVTKNGTVNMMDKFIYQSSKGHYIRVLTKPERYMRVYLYEFEEAS